jgi:hypothetical protein
MRPRHFLSVMIWLLLNIAAAGTAAAQGPFVGTWKLNQEKSQLVGNTMKFGPAADQAIQLSTGGTTYSFRTDGANYAMPSGNNAIWRQTSAQSWSTEYRTADGRLLSSDSWKLSADGKSLSITTSGVKTNGDLYTNTEQYVRTEGTSGLMGSWKSTSVKLSSPDEFTIQESGFDGLLFKIPAMKATYEAKFDGRDVAVQGTDIPTGLRLALTRTGPSSFRLVEKLNGSTTSSSQYTVSADGKTMTEQTGAPGDPPATMIWEKQ